ncbi:MAG: glycosyltransferase family 4 protein [Candidatus Nezhaarchaeales archaeon]
MNVLILGPRESIPPTRGGAIEKLTFDLARALKKYGFVKKVVLIATTEKRDLVGRWMQIDGVDIFYISTPIKGSLFYFTVMPQISSRIKKVYEKLRNEDGNEWIVHSTYFYNLISFKSADPIIISEFEHYPWMLEHLYHKPFISTVRRMRWELDARLRIELAHYIMRKARVIHAVSKFQAEEIRRQIPREYKQRIVVIPNFVNTEVYRPQDSHDVREKLGGGNYEVLAGFIGRLTPHKNLHVLLMALARIRRDLLRKVKVVVVGPRAPGFYMQAQQGSHSYNYLKFIHDLIEKYDLRNNVIFTGTVEEKHLPRYISAIDFLVHPSFVEAFGLVLLESMACGKPVVAFDIPPINEVVNENVGVLARISVKDLASKIELLVENEKLRRTLGNNAISYVRKVYDVKRIARIFYILYKNSFELKANK